MIALVSSISNAQEVCDNGIDDDGDGLVDCFDPDCQNSSTGCVDFYFGADTPECRLTPDPLLFSMEEQYRTTNNLGHDYVVPAVGDLDGDGIPEIVTISPNDQNRKLYVLNGLDGSEIASIQYEGTYHSFAGGPTIVDVDKDGTAEIFMVTGNGIPAGGQNHAAKQWVSRFEFDGGALTQTYKAPFGKFGGGWGGSVANRVSVWDSQKWATPQFVDFNGDGTPEMFIGNQVLDVATGAIIAGPPNDDARMDWPRGKQGTGDLGDYMSAAYDVLPDGFCANCSGVELVCGNTIYAVDLSDPGNAYNGISIEAQMTPTGTYGDGFTSLADWDGDGEMDVIVVAMNASNDAYVYIWNPRTQSIIQGPVDIKTGDHSAGRATVADFDGDGVNELSIVSKNELNVFESDLTKKWTNVTSDGSAKTSATAFDFEGDGNMEVVYRDEETLFILDGVTGNTKASFPCGSGTRVDMPVVVDVDADGEAEIVCSCIDRKGDNDDNNDTRHTVVFKSAQTPWVSTRKVWNSFHYSPTFINDDLTIPVVRQNKALIQGLDIYGAQTPILNKLGQPVFPGLPDVIANADSVVIGDCADDSVTVYMTICEEDNLANIWGYPISYYDDDPTTGAGTLINTFTVDSSLATILSDSCVSISFKVHNDNYNLHIFANDDGSDPLGAPATSTLECDSSNNLTFIPVGCRIVNYDTVTICLGDTAILEATDTTSLAWLTTENYDVVNDSVINALPLITSYYIANSLKYTDSIYVIVNSLPTVNLRNDTTICIADAPLLLDAGNPTAAFYWNVDSTSQIITIDATGEYIVEITDTNGCINSDTMNLVVNSCNTDAEVTKTDFTDKYFAGATTIYTIIARNHGPADVTDGDISDPLPTGISAGDVTWTATTFGGATTAAVGVNNGALTDVANIPAGDSIVYTVNILVPPTFTGDLVNTVTIIADNDTFPDNDVAVDTDTKDCNFEASGTIDSRVAGWVKMGNVVTGVPYKISPTGGSRTFVPTNGPEAGETITALIYNTGTRNSVSLTRNRYRPDNSRIDQLTIYDNSPHGWTGLSGSGTERPPVLGFMAFIDVNRNGRFDSGLETFYRDITSLTMTPNTSGELYMAFYDDGVYTDNSGTIGISIKSELESTNIGADTAICVGQSVTLDAQNPDAASWEWSTGETTQTINIDTAGEYSVEITSVGGCEVHDTIIIETHDIDVLLPNDTAFCFGESYDIVAQSDSAVVWNWESGETGQSITVDATGDYKITVENSFGCSDSDSVTITVNALPVVTVRDTTICPGGTGTFEAVSATATNYLWQKEGDGTTQSITDSIVGFYEVIVTDANGCKDTAEAELTLHTPPVVTVNNYTICIGDPAATFTATSATATSYVWSENGTGTAQTTTGTTTGDYTVIVEDINTCKDTATGVLKVDTLPIVSLDGAAICDGETSVDLTAESTTAVEYAWSGLGAGTTKTITAITQGNYIVTVTDENGCQNTVDADLQRYPMPTVTVANQSICPGEEATFTAVSATATEYLWQKEGTGIVQTTLGSIAGMYEVIVSDVNGCKDTAEAELTIYVAPEVTVNNNRICVGDPAAIFTATSASATSYDWRENGVGILASTSGSTAGNYTVIVTDANTCKDTATGVLIVDTLPVVTVEDTVICSNVTAELNAISSTAQSYSWSGLGTGSLSTITAVDPGNYEVTVTDINGCSSSDNATVYVVEQPEPFDIIGDLTACEGDVINLSIDVIAQTKEWDTGESGNEINVTENGTYSVIIANEAHGLTCEETQLVTPVFLPYAEQPETGYYLNCFDHALEIPVTINSDATIDWGEQATSRTNELMVEMPGLYTANLYYYEQCQITADVEVEEFCPYTVFVPNAFTPNDDGRNDKFQPKVTNIIDYKLYIFNRWGDLIFTSNHQDNQWDGTYMGNPAQIDVYVYKLFVNGNKSLNEVEEQQFVGTVSLIR